MTATNKIDAIGWLRKQFEQAPDAIREVLAEAIMALMNAEADALCGAGYGERSAERVNQRNGYRTRPWDTRVGTIALDIPKLRHGSYFPPWLLEPRRRAEQALTPKVGAQCSGSTSSRARTALAGWRFCAASSLAGCAKSSP